MTQHQFCTRLPKATILACASVLAALSGCAKTAEIKPNMVSAWVRTWYGAIRVERISPAVASRATAYAATALYAGVASVSATLPVLDSTLNGVPPLPRAERPSQHDGTIVAVVAERVVLDSLFVEALPTTRAAFSRLADSLVSDRLSNGVSSAERARSDSLGVRIGLAIVAWSRTDGFTETRGRPYGPPVGEGLWFNDAPGNIYASQNLSGASEFVALDNPANQQRAGNTSDRGLILSRPKSAFGKTLPPANMAGANEPYWREIRPFILSSWSACPLVEPPAYSKDTTSEMYKNARAVHDAQTALTPEQRMIAYYWADNAGESGTPPGHWLAIASQMIAERKLDAAAAARLVLATSVAQADAFISSWGYKYQFNLLRPRVYLRRVIDQKWEPLIPTPPFPEHPSGHSTQSSAAAAVLTAFLTPAPFTDSTSIAIGHAARKFESFTAASAEAGMSRVYGGIHFPSGNSSGQTLGRCIGAAVVEAFGASATAGTSLK